MADFNDPKANISNRAGLKDISLWCAFGAGMLSALTGTYLAIARPIASELARLQDRVVVLDQTVKMVAGQEGSVKSANNLLALLNDQGRRSAAASDALDRIGRLHEQLAQETRQVERALIALENLSVLKSSLLATAPRLEEATAALAAIQDVQERLVRQQPTAAAALQTLNGLTELADHAVALEQPLAHAEQVVDQWTGLQDRLIAAGGSIDQARQTGEDLIGLQHDLVSRGEERPAARAALESLIAIRERLDVQATGIAVAEERAAGLIAIKDRVIAQTANLADAIETLELTSDLHEQLEKSLRSFERMRHSVIEMLAFESTIERAVNMLQPLTALGNLRHLNGGELREVARAVRDQRRGESHVQTSPASLSTQADSSAALPGSSAK